jgi:uncharacterized protein
VKALRWALPFLVVLGFAFAANAAEVAIPPAPSAWVTDTAGFLTPQTVDTLDARLRAYQATTGHQILVYVAPTTGVAPTEDWTERAFARWKVGRKGIDDGLVMFVFPTDHKVRIEVGYGLEQTVPDAIASRIIRNTVTPKIRAGQPDQAVVSGVDEILGVIGGEAAPAPAVATAAPAYDEGDSDQSPWAVFAGILIALLICAGVFWLLSKLPEIKGTYISGGNSGSGWGDAFAIGGMLLGGALSGGGSGGGFSGGGGSGGGGGATGSW